MRFPVVIGLLLLALVLSGCVQSQLKTRDTSQIAPTSITTFQVISNAEICQQDGKPIIRLYSTTWCPHCKWINDTFNGVMKEYVDQGKIVAMHWDVDIKDDQFTPKIDDDFPVSELELFQSVNPNGTIPTYVFGCKYYRVGNGFETQDDLDAEAGEFKALIEKLLAESDSN
ncbi:MAG: thioredoxin family protein [Candidatus Iainarchaeum archaeon]|uniref:Thioredoxin family protein n=1 Tax=Candidatus Iainarchaeum sp. TaxID=3101447 RepID=A0A7T9I1U3_9ARCH|nr:MAG: thioredoxin family protein [Candidatus Diapherotrites archaeon]